MKDIINTCNSEKHKIQYNIHINDISYNLKEIRGTTNTSIVFDDTLFVSDKFGPDMNKINGININYNLMWLYV